MDEVHHDSRIASCVLLFLEQDGFQKVAGQDGCPKVIPVHVDESCYESVQITRVLEERLGFRIFLRQVIELPKATHRRRLFIVEIQGSPPSGYSWISTEDSTSNLAECLEVAFSEFGSDDFYRSVIDEILNSPLPWCRPGWLKDLQMQVSAYFSEPTEIQPYKLRLGYNIMRAVNTNGMYEVHATTFRLATWLTGEPSNITGTTRFLAGWQPNVIARFPDLGAELREAPVGMSLALSGDLSGWSLAMTKFVEFQIDASIMFDSTVSIDTHMSDSGPDFLLDELTSNDFVSQNYGKRFIKSIRECVSEAAETLSRSVLPCTLINGAMSGFNTYVSNGAIQVTEWRILYVGHPFSNLARLLTHRSDALARHRQVDLARSFVSAWMKVGRPVDVSKEVNAGIIIGSAIQAYAAWALAQSFPCSATPPLAIEMRDWFENIFRRS